MSTGAGWHDGAMRGMRVRAGRRAAVALVLAVGIVVGTLVPAGDSPVSALAAPASDLPGPVVVAAAVAPGPSRAPSGTLWGGSAGLGVRRLCERAVAAAPSSQAQVAIRAAFGMLGAPYACGDVGRSRGFRFDCSSLVARAYAAAGIPAAGPGWSTSTRDMVPWDGRALAPWARRVAPSRVLPGDLVLYSTGASLSRHVVLYLGGGYMLHSNYCGGVAHVEAFWGFGRTGRHRFLVARRVVVPGPSAARPRDLSQSAAARATRVSFGRPRAHDSATTVRVQKALNDVVGVGLLVDGRWDGGLYAAVVGFRRMVLGMSSDEAGVPLDRMTLRQLGSRSGFALVP